MNLVRRTFAGVFSQCAGSLLRLTGWKRATVYANLRHVSAAIAPADNRAFYRTLVNNLAYHAGELLFGFAIFKKLPAETAAYPYRQGGLDFRLAEGSAPVLEKMRGGGIFLTAHFGNYEAIGPWLCRLGIPLVASYIPVKPVWLNRILDHKIRSVDGRPYGVDARTPREFLRLLDCGKLFCLLADQDSRIPSALPGTFLGQSANMNPLPDFLLRHRPETPVYICWLEDACGQFKTSSSCGQIKTSGARVLHAIELPRASDARNNSDTCNENSLPRDIMPAFNAWLESRIKENPALWYGWTHRRFYSKNPEIYLG